MNVEIKAIIGISKPREFAKKKLTHDNVGRSAHQPSFKGRHNIKLLNHEGDDIA